MEVFQAPLGEHLLNIAVTQSEPGVQPDRMADDIGWEAVTLKGELAHRASLISISPSGQPSLCDNAYIPTPRDSLPVGESILRRLDRSSRA